MRLHTWTLSYFDLIIKTIWITHRNYLNKATDSGFIQNQKINMLCRKIVFKMLFYKYTQSWYNFYINKVSCSVFQREFINGIIEKHNRRDSVWTWDMVSNQYKKNIFWMCGVFLLSSCLLCHIHVVPSSHTIIHCQIHVHVFWHFIKKFITNFLQISLPLAWANNCTSQLVLFITEE